jgi:DNA gyrase subunit A
VAIKTVKTDDDIMIITGKGIIIRTGLDELREIGRNTQGVRLIKLDEDDKVVAVERVVKEEKEEGETPQGPQQPPEEPKETGGPAEEPDKQEQ